MRNMHAFGQSGVDLYVRDTYWGTAVPDKDAAPGKVYEHIYFRASRGSCVTSPSTSRSTAR